MAARWRRKCERSAHEVSTGERTLAALAIVVGVAVLREGSEVVLFLYGIVAQGGMSPPRCSGRRAGLCAGAGVSALMYFGLLDHSGASSVRGHILADHAARRGDGGAGGPVPSAGRLL